MTDRTSLARALREAGLDCVVESRERLALLTAREPDTAWNEELRDRVVRLAREHGFTHVALECGMDADERADLRRD